MSVENHLSISLLREDLVPLIVPVEPKEWPLHHDHRNAFVEADLSPHIRDHILVEFLQVASADPPVRLVQEFDTVAGISGIFANLG